MAPFSAADAPCLGGAFAEKAGGGWRGGRRVCSCWRGRVARCALQVRPKGKGVVRGKAYGALPHAPSGGMIPRQIGASPPIPLGSALQRCRFGGLRRAGVRGQGEVLCPASGCAADGGPGPEGSAGDARIAPSVQACAAAPACGGRLLSDLCRMVVSKAGLAGFLERGTGAFVFSDW